MFEQYCDTCQKPTKHYDSNKCCAVCEAKKARIRYWKNPEQQRSRKLLYCRVNRKAISDKLKADRQLLREYKKLLANKQPDNGLIAIPQIKETVNEHNQSTN